MELLAAQGSIKSLGEFRNSLRRGPNGFRSDLYGQRTDSNGDPYTSPHGTDCVWPHAPMRCGASREPISKKESFRLAERETILPPQASVFRPCVSVYARAIAVLARCAYARNLPFRKSPKNLNQSERSARRTPERCREAILPPGRRESCRASNGSGMYAPLRSHAQCSPPRKY